MPTTVEEQTIQELERSAALSQQVATLQVTLSDGSLQPLAGLSHDELHRLQWQEEQRFAELIAKSKKNSPQRQAITTQAYDTITTILAQMQCVQQGSSANGPLVMGWDNRYERLVLEMLGHQYRRGIAEPSLFEIGFSSGALLKKVEQAGYEVGGIEVSQQMHQAACEQLTNTSAEKLKLGGFLQAEFMEAEKWYSLVYWNDVFEHIAVDEIEEYLAKICSILAPGGSLITITPNWHQRPSDVTGDFNPPRTEARGFHLKEYTLRETTDLLHQSGFQTVRTPLLITKNRHWLKGSGLIGMKRKLEPVLEYLPFYFTEKLINFLGYSCTIATKGV